ncbi:hypothetical protein [Caldivirga sp.]
MHVLTTGIIIVKAIKGKEYVYLGNIEHLKKLKGKKVYLLVLENYVTPP